MVELVGRQGVAYAGSRVCRGVEGEGERLCEWYGSHEEGIEGEGGGESESSSPVGELRAGVGCRVTIGAPRRCEGRGG